MPHAKPATLRTPPSRPAESPVIVGLPISTARIYECGATLFAYLAFPEPDAEQRRADAMAALCHEALRAESKDNPSWLWEPTLIKPGYALMREKDVKAALRTVDRRLRDRLNAALMAKPLLQQGHTGKPPRLPPGVERATLQSMAEYVAFRNKPDTDRGETKHIHERVWQPSLPVIHLAVALNLLFERTRRMTKDPLAVSDIIRSREAIEFLVSTAADAAKAFEALPRLGIDAPTLVNFRTT